MGGLLQQRVELVVVGLRHGGAVHPGPDCNDHNCVDICEHLGKIESVFQGILVNSVVGPSGAVQTVSDSRRPLF